MRYLKYSISDHCVLFSSPPLRPFSAVQFREDAGCHESLLVASYEPAETNFFTELPPLNATEAAGALTLEAVVKDIVMPMLEPTSEVYSTLLSR